MPAMDKVMLIASARSDTFSRWPDEYKFTVTTRLETNIAGFSKGTSGANGAKGFFCHVIV